MTPVDSQNSAIPGAIPLKMGENLSRMRPNRHVKFHADRWSPGWEIRNRTYKKWKGHSKLSTRLILYVWRDN